MNIIGNWLNFDSVRGRLLVALLAAGVLPIVIIAVASHTISGAAIKESEEQKHEALCSEYSRQIRWIMRSAAVDLAPLTSNRVLRSGTSSDADRYEEMKRLVDLHDLFSDITLYDNDGVMLLSTTEKHPVAVDRSAWFNRAVAGEEVLTPPNIVRRGESDLYLAVYLPVDVKVGGRQVLCARLPFKPVWDLLDDAQLGKGGKIVLVDSWGRLLYDRNRDQIKEKFSEDGEGRRMVQGARGYVVEPDGNEYFFVTNKLSDEETKIPGEAWSLVMLIPREEIAELATKGQRSQGVAMLAVLIFSFGFGVWFSKKLTRPLVVASEAAEDVAHRKVVARIPDEGTREMRLLARAFNKMVEEVSCHREELESLVDIRTRKLRESQGKLEEISAQLRAAFESTREAILIVRRDGVVITANRRIKEYFGLSNQKMTWGKFENVRESFFDCFADREGFEESWDRSASDPDFTCEGEWEIVGPEPRVVFGYTVPVRNQAGESFAHLWTFEDITRERELQRGLEQAQKMEAIGRLAGGVAHDFNNLLTGIIGNLSLVEMAAGSSLAKSGANKYIVTAKQAGERAAELVKQLLGFSRKSHLTLEHCDVNGIVAEVSDLLRHTLDPRISIETDVESGLWGVRVDPTQVQQVVMNMCVNAKDALEESGTIRLRTENVTVDQEEAGKHDALPGDYVRLCVADDGQGIPREILDKVFEPFFTTKEPGKGTGLGLATCYGIVQQHGGWIECESEVGAGTTFSIFLPRREQKAVEAPPPGPGPEQPSVGGSESILLVDDDLVVRGVAECVLKHHGYDVVCASDGREAVDLVRERGGQFSLVLLDLTMPNISGKDAFKMIKEIRPEMKVLFCSGYLLTYEEFEEDGGYRPEGFVQKPYDVTKLASSVRGVIDEEVSQVPPGSPVEA